MLLEVVSLARDVRRDFHAVRQTNAADLPKGRVRLLRRGRVDANADAALLRAGLERRRSGLHAGRRAAVTNELIYRRHRSVLAEAGAGRTSTGPWAAGEAHFTYGTSLCQERWHGSLDGAALQPPLHRCLLPPHHRDTRGGPRGAGAASQRFLGRAPRGGQRLRNRRGHPGRAQLSGAGGLRGRRRRLVREGVDGHAQVRERRAPAGHRRRCARPRTVGTAALGRREGLREANR